jgi:hypothetical protein
MVKRSPIDKRSNKDYWDKQHLLSAENPRSWKLEAESLKRAADILWETWEQDWRYNQTLKVGDECQPPVGSIAMMLFGFCIENLVKSILASKNRMLDEKGKFKERTHDLLKLFEKAEVKLDNDENYLVERLEQFIIWAGRYPIPLKAENKRPRTLSGGGFAPLHISGGNDKRIIDRLIDKLQSLVP